MKIASLHVTNFLGIAAADVQTPEPVQLFAGANGAGKSSLRDAVALALTGDLGRVSLKKDSGQLVHEGADLAVCLITDADGDEYKVSINTAKKVHDGGMKASDPIWPYVLDAQRFAGMKVEDRRAFLYGLMNLKTDGDAIVERLKSRHLDTAKIALIKPLLRAGFDSACSEAKSRATAAKGAWKGVTGDNWGSEKAKGWRASVPPYDPKLAPGLATELQHCDVAIEQWQQSIGNLGAKAERRESIRARLPALEEVADGAPRIRTKLGVDEKTLTDVTAILATAKGLAGGAPRVGYVHELARLVYRHVDVIFEDDIGAAQEALAAYEKQHGPVNAPAAGDITARARLPDLQAAVDSATRTVANDRRDLLAADTAKSDIDTINAELAEAFDDAALAAARAQVAELKVKRAAIVEKIDAQKTIKALVDGAEAKTRGAALHAADVAAWDAIADALAPDGIPGEILAQALGPFNQRLAQSAADAQWPLPAIGGDMAITAGGRDYRLLSESERWRVDAMVAEAVAHLSGARLLVLDRFDMLDLPAREDLLAWLDVLATTGEIDTALVFGTLKAIPAGLQPSTAGHWIENGVVALLKEAA